MQELMLMVMESWMRMITVLMVLEKPRVGFLLLKKISMLMVAGTVMRMTMTMVMGLKMSMIIALILSVG